MFLGLRGATNASRILHLLVARMGDHNAVVISQKTLAGLLKCDERTIQRGVAMLKKHRWIDVRQIGASATVNAYVINDKLGWTGPRDGIRYSQFSATIVVADVEQPDKNELDDQSPLRRIPALMPGEQQLPTGPGLDPPSQPSLTGLEPDLPSRTNQIDIEDYDPETGELTDGRDAHSGATRSMPAAGRRTTGQAD